MGIKETNSTIWCPIQVKELKRNYKVFSFIPTAMTNKIIRYVYE